MQVTSQDDHITHAVVGQQEVAEMGVSDSASLMHILSTALYTHPKLATVREITCNGWDGHIQAGITNRPLEVTISHSSLTIRDFGPGIPHDKIGLIYGTYGNSTKRDDSKSTGGFGLGSKAPFAYVDNFEVISRNQGVKTIYRVSKSSMALGGKPSINKIVDVPTDETGISVTFDIRPGDMDYFMYHLGEVAKYGEIPMLVNETTVLPMLPISESPTGYVIGEFDGTLLNKINIRYGNVVYPIPKHEAYVEQFDFIRHSLRNLGSESRVIFMAPPDSISIQPSREALILSDKTVATINTLLRKFDAAGLKQGNLTGRQVINHLVKKAIAAEQMPLQQNDIWRDVPVKGQRLPNMDHPAGEFAFTVRRAQLHHVLMNASGHLDTRKAHMKRLFKLSHSGRIDQKFGMAIHRVMRRDASKHKPGQERMNQSRELHKIIAKHVTLPFRLAFDKEPKMNMDRLFVADTYNSRRDPELVPLRKAKIRGLGDACGFLFQRVLIARNKTAVKEFFVSEYHKHGYGRSENSGWLVYLVPHNDKSQQIARDLFKAMDYEVTERLPVKQVFEKPEFVGPPLPKKPTKKRKTMISLSQCFDGDYWLLNTGREENHKNPQNGVLDPIAYVQLNSKSEGATRFRYFSQKECLAIQKLWGDQIAVVTGVQAEKLAEKGVPELKAYIYTYADETLSAKEDFRRYLAFQGQASLRRGSNEHEDNIVKHLCAHESMMLELGLRFYVSPETALLINFFEEVGYGNDSKMPKCVNLKKVVKPSPKYAETVNRLSSSPWAKFIKMNVLSSALENTAPNSEKAQLPYEILRKLLNQGATTCQQKPESSRLP
uniref:Histidine kinase/HSP90-like ATPase n=1 Tax=Pseudomonas phage Arace01 TaxID=3138526 RepID=A0AAU6W007_9VIRU